MLIDPSFSPDAFVQRALDQNIAITHVVNTHSHPDHVNGNEQAMARTGAPLVAHTDAPTPPGIAVTDGQEIAVGSLVLQVFPRARTLPRSRRRLRADTRDPDHGRSRCSSERWAGRGAIEDARTEWDSLQRVKALPDGTTVWPGHDYGVRPSSTIALEKASNPFLRCADVDAFLALKRDWAAVKQRYGLK